jgi:hypothetical protein
MWDEVKNVRIEVIATCLQGSVNWRPAPSSKSDI